MNNQIMKIAFAGLLASAATCAVQAAEPGQPYQAKMSPDAKMLRLQPEELQGLFAPDPMYVTKYNAEKQLEIYGGKYEVKAARPLLEIGRDLYTEGPYNESFTIGGWHPFGKLNPLEDSFLMAYGDLRTAVAFNQNRGQVGEDGALGDEIQDFQIATRLNLDVDLKLTSTERIHAFFQPLQDGGKFTRYVFSSDIDAEDGEGEFESDLEPITLFFETDLAVLMGGFLGKYNKADIPFAVGRIPFVMQNGIWAEDAFLGAAITPLVAKNSPLLNISNMDITLFYGIDELSSPGLTGDEHEVVGVSTWLDVLSGYIEAGFASVEAENDDESYFNATASFTRRYFHKISNSLRVIYNFDQDGVLDAETGTRADPTADGWLILVENSLITSLPSTLVPYANFFVGIDSPQSLMRANAAGGVLKNTGLAFETDGLTGFPTLNASARDAAGGAIGVEYLFALDQQLVLEAAATISTDTDVSEDEYGLGVRYQRPLNFEPFKSWGLHNRWIIRTDAMVGFLEDQEIFGGRMELRRKF